MIARTALKWRSAFLGTVGASLLVSAVDVWRTLNEAALFWQGWDRVLLALTVLLFNLLLAGAVVSVMRRWLPAWSSLWFPLGVLAFLYGAEWWFRSPPPHVEAAGVRGDFLPFVAGLLCTLGLAWALQRAWIRKLTGLSLALILAVVVLRGEDAHQARTASSGAPNVLLVSVDTLRADHIGAWGDTKIRTPNIDALASRGVRFSRGYAPIAVTGPSHAAMMTGAGPWTTQMLLNGVPLPSDSVMLAERLVGMGYRTGAFVSAYVLDGDLGFQRGFEVYDSSSGQLPGFSSTGPGQLTAMVERLVDPHGIVERRGDQTVDVAIDWMRSISEQPFFAWVHLFDPHGPYAPPPPWSEAYYRGDPRDERHESMSSVKGVAPYLSASLAGIRDLDWVKAQYAGEVSFVDEQVGRLLDWLGDTGHMGNTLVIFVGDHGESLGEDGVWFNHGGNLDPSAIAVPLVMAWPGQLPPETVVDEAVGVVDVAPTVMSLLGESFMSSDGVDLSPSWTDAGWSRPSVKSVCFDRETNQKERHAGRIQKPTYLMARVWSEVGSVQVGTHPSRGAKAQGSGEGVDLSAAVGLLQAVTQEAHDKAASRDADRIERLKTLGYVE